MPQSHGMLLYLSPIERRLVRIAQLTGPLIAKGPSGIDCAHGTAFIVGERLAITAAHVVTGYLQHLHGVDLYSKLPWHQITNISLEMGLVMLLPSTAKKIIQLEIISARILAPGDIALLELGDSKNYPWQSLDPYPQVRLCGPNLNENVFSFGYPTKSIRRPRKHSPIVNVSPATADGKVLDVDLHPRSFPSQRVPRFQTDAEYLPGMSGSPIVGDDGRVCGVVASSIPGVDDESPISFGSILWPLVSAIIRRRILGRNSTRKPRSLVFSGLLDIVDYQDLPSSIRDLHSSFL